jgi:hypothetical protein
MKCVDYLTLTLTLTLPNLTKRSDRRCGRGYDDGKTDGARGTHRAPGSGDSTVESRSTPPCLTQLRRIQVLFIPLPLSYHAQSLILIPTPTLTYRLLYH